MPLLVVALVFAAATVLVWAAAGMLGTVGAEAGQRYRSGVVESAEAAWLRITPQQSLALSILSAFLLALPTAILTGVWFLAALAALLGLGIPPVALRLAKRRRDARFIIQLVDALGSLSNSLKAGFSLPQAFDLIAREMDPPIKQEFGLLTQEMRLGVPMDKALGNLLARMPGQDLDLVVTSIDVSREVGGAIGIAVLATVLNSVYQHRAEGFVQGLPADAAASGSEGVNSALMVAEQIGGGPGTALAAAARAAFYDGYQFALYTGSAILVVGAVLCAVFAPRGDCGSGYGERQATAPDEG